MAISFQSKFSFSEWDAVQIGNTLLDNIFAA